MDRNSGPFLSRLTNSVYLEVSPQYIVSALKGSSPLVFHALTPATTGACEQPLRMPAGTPSNPAGASKNQLSVSPTRSVVASLDSTMVFLNAATGVPMIVPTSADANR